MASLTAPSFRTCGFKTGKKQHLLNLHKPVLCSTGDALTLEVLKLASFFSCHLHKMGIMPCTVNTNHSQLGESAKCMSYMIEHTDDIHKTSVLICLY